MAAYGEKSKKYEPPFFEKIGEEKPEGESVDALKKQVRLLESQLIEARNVIDFLESELRTSKELATVDELTGLKNRRAFEEELTRVAKELYFGKSHPERREKFRILEATLIMLDIDNFKKVNDTYGHPIGDKVLQSVAGLLKSLIRDTDFVGRWGGEEMAAILLGAGEKEGVQKAEEIRNALMAREITIPGGEKLRVTASFGVAVFEEKSAGDPEVLVGMADDALYLAKQTGKNKVCTFSEYSAEALAKVAAKE